MASGPPTGEEEKAMSGRGRGVGGAAADALMRYSCLSLFAVVCSSGRLTPFCLSCVNVRVRSFFIERIGHRVHWQHVWWMKCWYNDLSFAVFVVLLTLAVEMATEFLRIPLSSHISRTTVCETAEAVNVWKYLNSEFHGVCPSLIAVSSVALCINILILLHVKGANISFRDWMTIV